MDILSTIVLITIISKLATIGKKNIYKNNSDISVYVLVMLIKLTSLMFLIIYILKNDRESLYKLQEPKYKNTIFMIAIIGFLYTLEILYIAPIFQKMNYSKYKLLRTPISIIVTILLSKIYLKEEITQNMVISLLFLGIALYFYYQK